MALYLGNQKVSLRSGQDPTFDYGFDSNGRLVFANKNATEINNFLNYDSSYSEILDLSNLSKMEKVAVNGTADRKMEGLKGLLVSPNAPFTGSSPQINVSYTGLSKSALVSLFESAPYNVGYTVVGNPTIVDGVASGFSTSDYLYISDFPYTANNWEIQVKASTTVDANQQRCIYRSSSFQLRLHGRNTSMWELHINGVNTYLGDESYAIASYPYVKLVKTGSYIDAYLSQDGISYTQVASNLSIGSVQDGPLSFSTSGNIWKGYIDLNNTYIKVNGVLWFTGKPAMTKTCSIVGAAGTADLTQEDKNIILNKGWSLTVQ